MPKAPRYANRAARTAQAMARGLVAPPKQVRRTGGLADLGKMWYKIVAKDFRLDSVRRFAGLKPVMKDGAMCVQMTPAQARFFLDHMVIEPLTENQTKAPQPALAPKAGPARPARAVTARPMVRPSPILRRGPAAVRPPVKPRSPLPGED